MDLSQAQWRKSTYSGSDGGMCVEVAGGLPGMVALRDSKNPDGGHILLTRSEWAVFLRSVRVRGGGGGRVGL